MARQNSEFVSTPPERSRHNGLPENKKAAQPIKAGRLMGVVVTAICMPHLGTDEQKSNNRLEMIR